MSKQDSKPSYNDHAVATSLGWVDARNGEILVSYRGLEDAINLHGIARRDFVKVISAAIAKKGAPVETPAPAVEAETPPVQVSEPAAAVATEEEKSAPSKKTTKKTTKKKTATKKSTKTTK